MANIDDYEIPRFCFENLILAVDKDLDSRISLQELTEFVKLANIHNFKEDDAEKMFNEITQRRVTIHLKQKNDPLTLEEIIKASTHFIQL